MGEGNTTGEYFRKVREHNIIKMSPSGEKEHVTTGARLKKYAKTWWHERGGPAGVTDAYLKSIDTIHAAIPPGRTEEFFRSKIQPILEVRAKAAGYAAMVGEVVTAALVARVFTLIGRNTALDIEDHTIQAGEHDLKSAINQRTLDLYRDLPSPNQPPPAMVIDNENKDIATRVIQNDTGIQRTFADDHRESTRDYWKRVAKDRGAVVRGGGILTGIAAGAAIIERGPVHAAAKLSAKMEGAAGAAVVKIVDRIVRGW